MNQRALPWLLVAFALSPACAHPTSPGLVVASAEPCRADGGHVAGACWQSCGTGDGRSCYEIGRALQMRGDHHGAVAYFDIACGLGHGPSCTLLVEIYSRGRGARVDQIRAAHFMRQACKAAGVDCADATHAPSTPRAIELSAQAHRRACAAGQSAACANLALMVDLGMGVERDLLDAALLYGRACEGGSAASCGAYGMLFRDLTEDVEEASTHRPALGDLARGW